MPLALCIRCNSGTLCAASTLTEHVGSAVHDKIRLSLHLTACFSRRLASGDALQSFSSDRSYIQAVPIRAPVQMHDSGSLSPLGGLASCFAANPIAERTQTLFCFQGCLCFF